MAGHDHGNIEPHGRGKTWRAQPDPIRTRIDVGDLAKLVHLNRKTARARSTRQMN